MKIDKRYFTIGIPLIVVALAIRSTGWRIIWGGSMKPTLPFCTVYRLTKPTPDKIKPGAIVSFHRYWYYVKRVWKEESGKIFVRGDNDDTMDSKDFGWIPKSKVVGVIASPNDIHLPFWVKRSRFEKQLRFHFHPKLICPQVPSGKLVQAPAIRFGPVDATDLDYGTYFRTKDHIEFWSANSMGTPYKKLIDLPVGDFTINWRGDVGMLDDTKETVYILAPTNRSSHTLIIKKKVKGRVIFDDNQFTITNLSK